MATPICPVLNWLSLALTVGPPETDPARVFPTARKVTVYQVPVLTCIGALARVVAAPPTSLRSSSAPLLRRATW